QTEVRSYWLGGWRDARNDKLSGLCK
ncbi:ribosome modulation factor, partial [Vibrio cholerae]|nr:ribosome modulation factor [Vibrio cholerae]